MKINILGTEYDFVATTDTKDEKLCRCDGYCDGYEKHIAIETAHNQNDPYSTKNLDALVKRVKRHEIVHAFLFESGLMEYAENETIVDWIAWQFPKLLESFKETEAI